MKYIISHPLTEAHVLKEPLVATNVTWEQYIDILRAEAVKHRHKVNHKHKFELAVDLLAKWVGEDFNLSAPAAKDEEYLQKIREKLKDGKKVGLQGNPLCKKTVQKIFTNIRQLHNWVQASGQKPQKLLRPLVDGRLVNRFLFFNTLSAQTQKAMTTFEVSGTRAPHDNQLMTGQTREGGIEDTLSLLRRLNLKSLEQITPKHIAKLTANPDANNPEYRRICGILHHAAYLFRYCIRKGLLPNNPLIHIDNSLFANHAIRNFLPPDQLEILLDIHGEKGNFAVDLNDELSVRDRLVALLLVDLALRRSELASLSWNNIQYNRVKNGYILHLFPENQKMATKEEAFVPILYPATHELLEQYAKMRDIIIGQPNNEPLILNKRRLRASGGVISTIVKQVAAKLNLQTYYHSVLSCHDLRRTFATCNAGSLGLCWGAIELAERLRVGIKVVYEHYIVHNPLRTEEQAKKYREMLKPKDADEESLEMITKLESLNPDNNKDLLRQLRSDVTRRINAKQEAKELGHTPSWIDESEAISILTQSWNNMPRIKCLRKYFSSRKAIKRSGSYGMVYYDAVAVRELSDRYEPVSDHFDKVSRAISLALSGFDSISIGWLKLIKRDQMGTFLKSIREVDRKLSPYKTGQTGLTKLAKQEPTQTASKMEYAAIA